jgi:hypothetical protein
MTPDDWALVVAALILGLGALGALGYVYPRTRGAARALAPVIGALGAALALALALLVFLARAALPERERRGKGDPAPSPSPSPSGLVARAAADREHKTKESLASAAANEGDTAALEALEREARERLGF